MAHSEISNFVILDDEDSDIAHNFKKHFIKTHYNTLFTSELAQEALRIVTSNENAFIKNDIIT